MQDIKIREVLYAILIAVAGVLGGSKLDDNAEERASHEETLLQQHDKQLHEVLKENQRIIEILITDACKKEEKPVVADLLLY